MNKKIIYVSAWNVAIVDLNNISATYERICSAPEGLYYYSPTFITRTEYIHQIKIGLRLL